MQSSGTAQDIPARRNGLSRIKTWLNSDPNHAGPMEEKSKTSWEHFYNYLFTIKRGKACGTGKRFIRYVMQGKDERGVVCDNYTSNLQKQTQCRLDARLIKATITTMKILYRLI